MRQGRGQDGEHRGSAGLKLMGRPVRQDAFGPGAWPVDQLLEMEAVTPRHTLLGGEP